MTIPMMSFNCDAVLCFASVVPVNNRLRFLVAQFTSLRPGQYTFLDGFCNSITGLSYLFVVSVTFSHLKPLWGSIGNQVSFLHRETTAAHFSDNLIAGIQGQLIDFVIGKAAE